MKLIHLFSESHLPHFPNWGTMFRHKDMQQAAALERLLRWSSCSYQLFITRFYQPLGSRLICSSLLAQRR